jgi:hypothetical protein
VRIFKEILQNVHLIMLLGAFFLIAKMANFSHQKIALLPALTTLIISPDTDSDQIHPFCKG